jgi:hypothetical protein
MTGYHISGQPSATFLDVSKIGGTLIDFPMYVSYAWVKYGHLVMFLQLMFFSISPPSLPIRNFHYIFFRSTFSYNSISGLTFFQQRFSTNIISDDPPKDSKSSS